MVGVIAGQSISEPTEVNIEYISSFWCGIKSNVTRGVPRIEEILRLTKNPKILLIQCVCDFEETNEEKASRYANMLEHTKLVNVIKNIQICFDQMKIICN